MERNHADSVRFSEFGRAVKAAEWHRAQKPPKIQKKGKKK